MLFDTIPIRSIISIRNGHYIVSEGSVCKIISDNPPKIRT